MKTYGEISTIAFSIALALSGCMSPVTSGVSLENRILQFENGVFASRIKVVDATPPAKIDGGFLKVQVTVENASKRDLDCQYRFVWKDDKGMVLTSAETLWLPLGLHGREQRVIEAICPVPGAEDYRLVLRPLEL